MRVGLRFPEVVLRFTLLHTLEYRVTYSFVFITETLPLLYDRVMTSLIRTTYSPRMKVHEKGRTRG
jgi:hypothetical protein